MAKQKDALLSLLVRHCKYKAPKHGALYSNKNLMSMLQSRKWAWLPGRRRGVAVSSPSQYLALLPWFRVWIRRAQRYPGKTMYSAKAHTQCHTAFKIKTSSLFAKKVRQLRSKSAIIVLDDFDHEQGGTLRTLAHLKQAGICTKQMYVANPGYAQCQAAQRMQAKAANSTLEAALNNEWQDLRSRAAYLDTCSGSEAYVLSLIDAVLKRANYRFVLGYTLLGRGVSRGVSRGRREDWEDMSITSRLARIDHALRRHGFIKIGRSDQDALHAYSGGPSLVVTAFYERGRRT